MLNENLKSTLRRKNDHMAVNDSYRDFVLEQLEHFGPITAKKMFGGIGLFFDCLTFGLIAKDVMYLKTDDSNRAEYEKEGMGPFKPFENKPMLMLYYEVPADILENKVELVNWARTAWEIARNKPLCFSLFTMPKKVSSSSTCSSIY
ncbi:MAG: TfoX/Sxy family protein [Carboxydocellales bacterium]